MGMRSDGGKRKTASEEDGRALLPALKSGEAASTGSIMRAEWMMLLRSGDEDAARLGVRGSWEGGGGEEGGREGRGRLYKC